jgi:general stress protein YciG
MVKNTQSSQKKGRGWHGDSKAHAKVGRMGGLTTASRFDETFYSQIGRLGGRVSSGNFKNNPNRAKIAGRKGGLSKKR